MSIELAPCPFCGGKASFVRKGSGRQSCIVSCGYCGCSLESSESEWNSGNSWNHRTNACEKTTRLLGKARTAILGLLREKLNWAEKKCSQQQAQIVANEITEHLEGKT
jgi:Lar family restriction alleviation protein